MGCYFCRNDYQLVFGNPVCMERMGEGPDRRKKCRAAYERNQ